MRAKKFIDERTLNDGKPQFVRIGVSFFVLSHIFIVNKKVKEGEELARGYYHRSFVILQPWDTKFNMKAEKSPAGYCKIEVRNDKCRMYFHVQDLKFQTAQQESYDIFLVSAQEGISPQRIATIDVDSRGRGECVVEVNVNDVGGSGYSLDQFHGLAVVRHDRDDISYPLVGYANKRVELDWAGRIKKDISRFYNKSVRTVAESRKESSQMRLAEENRSEKAHKEPLLPIDDKKQKSIQDIITALAPLLHSKIQEGQEEGNKLQMQQAYEKEDLDTVKGLTGDREKSEDTAMIKEQKKDEKDIDVQRDEGRSASEMLQDVFEVREDRVVSADTNGKKDAMLEEAPQAHTEDRESKAREAVVQEMSPEGGQIQEQADADESRPAEGESKIQGHTAELSREQTYWDKTKDYYIKLFETHRRVYPFIWEKEEVQWVEVPYVDDYSQYAYIAPQHIDNVYYDHYIVGLVKEKGEVRYVAYGIPGPYGSMPPVFMQGFSRWVPSRYGYGMGYWLMYVDAYTGEIAYPY